MDCLKFPFQFDVRRLQAELQRIETVAVWHAHPDTMQVEKKGDWTAIALIACADADPDDPDSLRYRGQPAGPTPLLLSSPYLQEVIASFKTEIHRARLMKLIPGRVINPHRDWGQQRYSLERGFIRVHIALRTHPEVYFYISGKRVPLREGEAWYTNVCCRHAVRNLSQINRVHLVLDMKVNDWLLQFFPEPTHAQEVWGAILRRYEKPVLKVYFALEKRFDLAKEKLGDWGLRRLKHWLASLLPDRAQLAHCSMHSEYRPRCLNCRAAAERTLLE